MEKYPPKNDKDRIIDYETFEKIFLGDHFSAFNVRSKDFRKDYANIRYLAINMGGLLSKLSADMLFEEFPQIRFSKKLSEWNQAFMEATKFKTQCYESALEGSYRGDALFKLRAKDGRLIVEDVNPSTWFPKYDPSNVRKEPEEHVFAHKLKLAGLDKEGVYMEIHGKGFIKYELWQLEGEELAIKLPLKNYFPNQVEYEETGIDDFLVTHIKNFGINSRFYGISDYKDLLPLMFAINNRITKIDNILDKHGDPILAVPKGVLDENGEVRKESFGLIEVDTSEAKGQVPQYIVWDAKLESAFKEIDYMLDFFFMTSETSKASFGLDEGGKAESGRALKFKLLRTIAKKHRKQLYYDDGLKELYVKAQKFAKANGLTVNGVKFKGEIETPEIIWQDGVVNDIKETIEVEETKLLNGLTTRVDAISIIEGIDQEDAQDKVAQIDEEQAKKAPSFAVTPVKADQNN